MNVEASTGMNAGRTINGNIGTDPGVLVEQIEDALRINKVYSEPISSGGRVVIPVARVRGGAGGGGGTGTGTEIHATNTERAGDGAGASGSGSGIGGGFGWTGRPYGAIVMREGQVRWLPTVDVNQLIAAVTAVVICALLIGRSKARIQAKSQAVTTMWEGRS